MKLALFFKNIAAIALACLVLVSTMSFTMSMHYCGSKLVAYSSTSKVKSCCKIAFKKQFPNKEVSFPCCKNKKIDKDSEDDILGNIAIAKIQLQSVLLLLPQLNLSNTDFQKKELKNELIGFKNKSFKGHPPSSSILYQVFII